jgi:hypothetical protein
MNHRQQQETTMSAYLTSSTAEAAFLQTRGFGVKGVQDQPDTFMKLFVFDPEAASVASEFYRNGTVEAQAFFRSLIQVRRYLRQPA